MYAWIAGPIIVELLLRRDRSFFRKSVAVLGLVAAVGSIGGVGLLGLSSALPAAIVFTLSSIFSLLGGGLSSVLFFREKANTKWFAMMGLAIVAVILVSV